MNLYYQTRERYEARLRDVQINTARTAKPFIAEKLAGIFAYMSASQEARRVFVTMTNAQLIEYALYNSRKRNQLN